MGGLASGYGCQTKLNTKRIHDAGHEVVITAFYGLEGGVLNMGGIPVLSKGKQPYGQDIIGMHAAKSDIMISLIDAWVCEPQWYPDVRWVPWFPIDTEPLSPAILFRLEKAYHRIVMSKHGGKMMDDAGLDYSYVPHGIETQVFKPMDKAEALEITGLPKDKFIVGMVAANKGAPSRKAFTQQIEAFSLLKKKHDDAVMYIHTCTAERGENHGVNLPEFCAWLDLKVGVDVIFPSQTQLVMGFGDDYMNALYNSFDVHTLVSRGEGFGIPIVEAQAAGCPVIVGDWSSMSELCFSGWKVKKYEALKQWTQLACYQWIPRYEAIADRMFAAYNKRDHKGMKERARDGALNYDIDKVFMNYWEPTLKIIQDKIDKEKEHEERVELVKF